MSTPMNQPIVSSPRGPRHRRIVPSVVEALAPAKINLNLLVGPRRPDGFHDLDSIVCKISFYDRLRATLRDDGLCTISCSGSDCGPDDKNLALRAARLLAPHAGGRGAHIELTKSIPPGKGLGGGSSDAASALLALNELWRLKLPTGQLHELAASLGSDVPLFLGPAVSRMQGRGEVLTPAAVHRFCAVLLLPTCACPTADVYRQFDLEPQAMGRQLDERLLAVELPSVWRRLLQNQLTGAARRVAPQLDELFARMGQLATSPVHLTGSGSAMFCLCDDFQEARQIAAAVGGLEDIQAVVVWPNGW